VVGHCHCGNHGIARDLQCSAVHRGASGLIISIGSPAVRRVRRVLLTWVGAGRHWPGEAARCRGQRLIFLHHHPPTSLRAKHIVLLVGPRRRRQVPWSQM